MDEIIKHDKMGSTTYLTQEIEEFLLKWQESIMKRNVSELRK